MVPNNNQMTVIKNIMPIGPKPRPKNRSWIMFTPPLTAKSLEYIDPAINKNIIGAVERPAS